MKINIAISAATSIVFHYTTISSLLHILKDNQFVLTTGIGTEADRVLNKKHYYLSLTRSRVGHYHAQTQHQGAVLLTLDGTRFNQLYQTSPVDYWGEEFRKHRGGAYEAEDRLFSSKPVLPNALNYIIDAAILLPKNTDYTDTFKKILRQVLLLCKAKHIHYNMYQDPKDWLVNNKSKVIPGPELESLFQMEEEPRDPNWQTKYFPRDTTKKKYFEQRKFTRHSVVKDLLELYHKKDYNLLSKDAKDYVHKIVYDWMNEQLTVLKNEVHNERTKPLVDRKYVDNLVAILTKDRIELKPFYEQLVAKWRAILDQGRS